MIAKNCFAKITFSFLIPGHSKQEPDALFSLIANNYYNHDVFNTSKQLNIAPSCNADLHELELHNLRLEKEKCLQSTEMYQKVVNGTSL